MRSCRIKTKSNTDLILSCLLFGTVRVVIFIYFLIFFLTDSLWADDDNLNDRNRLANRRNERFYKGDIVRHFISLSGEYDSDENSKQKIISLDHFYKSRDWISDVTLRMETLEENDSSSIFSENRQHLVKESDEYRAIIAEKIIINDTKNYLIFFNETRYDDEADSAYYDIVVSGGVGRMFFNDKLEIDLGYGVSRGKQITDTTFESARRDYHRQIFVPAFRTEFRLFDKTRFIQRGYAYYSGDIDSYYLLTRLQYPLSKKVYLQFSHLFDKRSYELYDNRTFDRIATRNEVRRQILLGFRFDFGSR